MRRHNMHSRRRSYRQRWPIHLQVRCLTISTDFAYSSSTYFSDFRVYGAPASYHSLLVFLRRVPWLSVPHVTNAAEPAGTGTSNI
jgi:hypothetical protein